MTLTTALANSCDTYFYDVALRAYERPDSPIQKWARRMGFGQETGIDVGPEGEGLVPTPAWRKRHFESAWDQQWRPGDSIQLGIGQGDMLATPLQMTRMYALIANGGSLVQPRIVQRIVQPATEGDAEVVIRSFPGTKPEDIGLDPTAVSTVQEGLYDATHASYGTSTSVFSHFPVPIAGKTGTAEKFVTIGKWSGLRDQSWWCGWGPYADPELVVCAVIENGGHGGEAAAPAALKVFEKFFGVEPGSYTTRRGGVRLMAVRVEPRQQIAPLGAEATRILRHLDYALLAAVAGLIAYGLWVLSAVSRNDVPGDPDYFVFRQSVNIAIGVIVLAAVALLDPEIYRRIRVPLYAVSLVALAAIFVADPVRGTRRWIDIGFFRFQPSELGKIVLILMLAGFVADRARRIDEWSTTFGAVGLAAAPAVLVFLEPDFGTAMVYAAIVAAVLFIAGTRWLHIGALAAGTVLTLTSMLWILPAAGDRDPAPVPDRPPDRLLEPGLRPERRDLQHHAVDHRSRVGRARRARRRGRDADEHELPARALDRLHLLVARRAARLPRRGAPPAPLRDRRLARRPHDRDRAEPLHRRARRRLRRRVHLPGVREHRDDGRDGADHRHPAPVRELRRARR